jgi:hypothetical protein
MNLPDCGTWQPFFVRLLAELTRAQDKCVAPIGRISQLVANYCSPWRLVRLPFLTEFQHKRLWQQCV